ncbi:type 1 glutamine amidotransferase domain-containing protein [Cognatiyoonia sp. IB215446]|uniref:type 1 glutamine amidotransferase domain-containing protein n=1 Tax=Cognatiyoonia sp. IB215446 TaxID=3097355 RepID=UPI002A1520E9|nr:type 1 glutamine amidotransferase domain-containing protein [Cognatiyoonia sp. IB215446]MDX8346971.1 type 1 glutamine amidotransferase domain-containing protein [Cognatiyoonia sp. IB215446]
MTKRILMLASNPAVSPVTQWPIGFWWAELSHAYEVFKDAGHDVTIASPGGGVLQADGYSDPEDESGYSVEDTISLAFKQDPAKMALLQNTPALNDLDMDDFDAIFVVGGQGPMVTMIDDPKTHKAVADFYEAGKVTAAVCHGTCVLLKTRLSNGDLLVKGKRWTGFADSEEAYAEKAVGMKIQPFWIESEARKLADTSFEVGGPLEEFAIRDGNLITGQQQVSAAAAARHVVDALA